MRRKWPLTGLRRTYLGSSLVLPGTRGVKEPATGTSNGSYTSTGTVGKPDIAGWVNCRTPSMLATS